MVLGFDCEEERPAMLVQKVNWQRSRWKEQSLIMEGLSCHGENSVLYGTCKLRPSESLKRKGHNMTFRHDIKSSQKDVQGDLGERKEAKGHKPEQTEAVTSVQTLLFELLICNHIVTMVGTQFSL